MLEVDQKSDMKGSAAVVLLTHAITKRFGKFTAVADLCLCVPEQAIYGFLGANGAGKTTTLRMLTGLLKPDHGTIDIMGVSCREIGVKQKKNIGYVAQEQHFYPWMHARQLGKLYRCLYPNWDEVRFTQLLDRLNIPPKRKTSELSGGMRTKLALALAISAQPPLLILDEPTAGLDIISRREVLDLILHQRDMRQGVTLFSTHVIEEVEQCASHVGVIDHGRLLFEGDLKTIREQCRIFEVPQDVWETLELAGRVLRVTSGAQSRLRVIAILADEEWGAVCMHPDCESCEDQMGLEKVILECIATSYSQSA